MICKDCRCESGKCGLFGKLSGMWGITAIFSMLDVSVQAKAYCLENFLLSLWAKINWKVNFWWNYCISYTARL